MVPFPPGNRVLGGLKGHNFQKILKRQITKCPTITVSDLQETFQELSSLSDNKIHCSMQRSLNIPGRFAVQKPLLADRMKKKKLIFARPIRTGPLSSGRESCMYILIQKHF
jgi:hypothetical protein